MTLYILFGLLTTVVIAYVIYRLFVLPQKSRNTHKKNDPHYTFKI